MTLLGDLITDDYQYQFGEFLFGSLTSYVTTQVDGLLSLAGARLADTDLSSDHGSVSGALTLPKRIVTFDVTIVGTPGNDIENKLAAARAAFQTPKLRKSRTEKPFCFQRPNAPKKWLLARCTKRDWSSTYEVAHGYAAGSVELTCSDPRIYSTLLATSTINMGIGASTNNITFVNNGDFEDGARPVITLTGPFTNPRIQNESDDDRTIALDVTIGAGDIMVIDTAVRTVKLSTDAGVTFDDAEQYLRTDNQWWTIMPGANTVVAQRTSTGAIGECKLEWYDVYA